MSRFREEMKVIPRGAWIIAILLYLFGLGCSWLSFFLATKNSSNGRLLLW